jgi:hypothetical protein
MAYLNKMEKMEKMKKMKKMTKMKKMKKILDPLPYTHTLEMPNFPAQITAARPVGCPAYERWRQNSSAHHLLPALAASCRQSSAYLLMAPVSEA